MIIKKLNDLLNYLSVLKSAKEYEMKDIQKEINDIDFAINEVEIILTKYKEEGGKG